MEKELDARESGRVKEVIGRVKEVNIRDKEVNEKYEAKNAKESAPVDLKRLMNQKDLKYLVHWSQGKKENTEDNLDGDCK